MELGGMIMSCHINKVYCILSLYNQKTMLKALWKLHDDCEISIRNLNSLGMVSGLQGHLLLPTLLKFLQESLVLEYHEKKKY